MRVEQVEVYRFHELSAKAKERARDWYRSVADYPWRSENVAALEAFASAFSIHIRDWSVDPCGHSYVRISFNEDWHSTDVLSLSGVRLSSYLQNTYGRWLEQPKRIARYFVNGKLWPNVVVGHNVTKRERVSRCQTEPTCCPFTGYYMDEELLGPMRAFILRPDSRDFREVMQSCVDAWAQAYESDVEYQDSDEAVDESLEANEYEFTVNGKRW